MYTFLSSGTTEGTGLMGTWGTLIMIVIMFAVFYFFAIRPQKKQEKETQAMRSALSIGDEIVTIGGIIGCVIIIKDDKLMLETGNGSKITILRSAIKTVLKDEEEAK